MAHNAHEIISRNCAENLSRDIEAFSSSRLRCFKEAIPFLDEGLRLKRDLLIPISTIFIIFRIRKSHFRRSITLFL